MFTWTCQPSLASSTIPRQMWENLGSSPQLLRWTSRIRFLQMIVTFEQLAIKNAGYGMPKIDFLGKTWPSGNSTAAAFGLFTGDSAISHCTGWIASVLLRSNDHVCKIQQHQGTTAETRLPTLCEQMKAAIGFPPFKLSFLPILVSCLSRSKSRVCSIYIYMSDGSCARFLALYLSLQLLFGFLPWLDFFIQRGFLINSWKCQC